MTSTSTRKIGAVRKWVKSNHLVVTQNYNMFISNITSGYKQTYILVEFVNEQNRAQRFKINKERNVSNGLLIL